jgi:hypothetical protein
MDTFSYGGAWFVTIHTVALKDTFLPLRDDFGERGGAYRFGGDYTDYPALQGSRPSELAEALYLLGICS